MYIPPFTISTNAINLIAEISAQIERYAIRLEQSDGLRLRQANRVRTIHSSLAIEGNTLSENEVKDIIDGKTVMAPLRQIQEVKNAIKTYELYEKLNPFDVNDLLKAHGTMMMGTDRRCWQIPPWWSRCFLRKKIGTHGSSCRSRSFFDR